ncbi:IclR family transcriptional regulator [Desulfosoma caldarium]|uniref:IclR family transcriptional regulator n=1 Tax=Desulfosoma caldarium TaxID=610254 RepID=A0A3N1URH6_9BACT|nr:IclR family transcriptional regulator [Desulfosoma caldarium]ROQ92009.1 IclR family transcriptional regulator [Desulfosoma caldarium]
MKRSGQPNAIEKALQVLLAFQVDRPRWGVRELATHLGFSPATIQRLLKTLKAYHFIDQDPRTQQYRLGTIYYRFLEVLQSQHGVVQEAGPVMRRLSLETGETVHLNVLDGRERLCVDSVESSQSLKAGMPVGNRSPLYAGASSKCLLAFAPKAFVDAYLAEVRPIPLTPNTLVDSEKLMAEIAAIRDRGWAESLAERTLGLGSLSVPIFSHNGHVLAALSMALPELRFKDSEHKKRCLDQLLRAGKELSQRMGWRGSYPVAHESGQG